MGDDDIHDMCRTNNNHAFDITIFADTDKL